MDIAALPRLGTISASATKASATSGSTASTEATTTASVKTAPGAAGATVIGSPGGGPGRVGGAASRGCAVTVCCGVDYKVPAARALRRRFCTEARQSCSCSRNASPSFCVQSSLLDIILRTLGDGTSDLTLASQLCDTAPVGPVRAAPVIAAIDRDVPVNINVSVDRDVAVKVGAVEAAAVDTRPVHIGPIIMRPSRPGEFHPEPLTDPDLTLSRHPARATERRLPPPVENWSSSCCQLAHSQRR